MAKAVRGILDAIIFFVQEAANKLLRFMVKRFPVPFPSLYMISTSFLYRPVE